MISPSQTFEHLCNAAVSVKPLGILIHCVSLHCSIGLLKRSTSGCICSPGSCLCVCLSLCFCLCWTLSVEPVSAELCVWNSEQISVGAQLSLSPSTTLTSEDECHSPLSFTSCHCALRDQSGVRRLSVSHLHPEPTFQIA